MVHICLRAKGTGNNYSMFHAWARTTVEASSARRKVPSREISLTVRSWKGFRESGTNVTGRYRRD